jgi:hypothetical protein
MILRGTVHYIKDHSKKPVSEINKVDNGFILKVSSRTLVFNTVSQLLKAIELFYTDFEKAETKYIKGK